VHITNVPHHRGYVGHLDVSPDPGKGGDIREAFKVALDLSTDDPDYQAGITLYGPNVWPRDMPEFSDRIYHTYQCFLGLSESIFSLFAIGLDLPADYFKPLIQKPASVMNVNYYPATDVEKHGEASGIGAHSDYEAFAMLWQDGVGGLQIESLQGEWEAVAPLENALVINIGDLMSHWTNDRFRATRHRVISLSGKERVSFACFGNTNYHAMIECIPSCCDANNPARYPPVKSGDYLMGAIKRTYAYKT
jgi:isopenicillin N synthase-like dioxygenase